jgi:hypothetical protein
MTNEMTYEEVRDTVSSWSIEGKRLQIVEFIDAQQRKIELARELIRVAQMQLNPKINEDWMRRASAFLKGAEEECLLKDQPLQYQRMIGLPDTLCGLKVTASRR